MFLSTPDQLYANYNIFIGSLAAKFKSLKKQIKLTFASRHRKKPYIVAFSFQNASSWVWKIYFHADSIFDGKN